MMTLAIKPMAKGNSPAGGGGAHRVHCPVRRRAENRNGHVNSNLVSLTPDIKSIQSAQYFIISVLTKNECH